MIGRGAGRRAPEYFYKVLRPKAAHLWIEKEWMDRKRVRFSIKMNKVSIYKT